MRYPRLRALLIALTGVVALSAGALVHAPQASAAGGDPLLTAIGGPKTAEDLDVMSFNLKSAETDRKDYDRRRSAIAEVILNERPDLIGTQAGVRWQQDNLWTDLRAAGGPYNWYGRQRQTDGSSGGGDTNETVGIFYNAERLEDVTRGDFWFCKDGTPPSEGCIDEGDGWQAGNVRMATWIRFRDKTTGTEFYAVNTELDWDNSQARVHGAQLIRDTMAAMTPALPIVLTGDFNSVPSGPSHRVLAESGYHDTWPVAVKAGEEFNTYRGDQEPIKATDERIDFILTRPQLPVLAAAINTYQDANGVYPSDHLPIQSRIRLPEARLATVVLGDSYTSGHGAGSTYEDIPCKRSASSYAPLFFKKLAATVRAQSTDYVSNACTGATTKDVIDTQLSGLSAGTDLVILTIGGNDLHFADVARTCVLNGSAVCTQALNDAGPKIETMAQPIADVLHAIMANAPNANIIMSGYPVIFATGACGLLAISEDNRDQMIGQQLHFNKVIETTVQQVSSEFPPNSRGERAIYADANEYFNGHRVCDQDPWINQVTDGIAAGDAGAAYHPNTDGHEAMKQAVFERYLNLKTVQASVAQSPSVDVGASVDVGVAVDGGASVDIAARDSIFEYIRDLEIPGLDGLSVGLDPVGNRVGVTIFAPKGLPAVVTGRLNFGDNVTIDVVKAERPRRFANVSGGTKYTFGTADGDTDDCTTGFAVGTNTGRSGFLTAGHCHDYTKPLGEQKALAGRDRVPMTPTEMVYETSDWGIYLLDGSPDSDQALPEVGSGWGNLPVGGIAEPATDMNICKYGIITRTTCGTVVMTDVRLDYPEERDESGNVTVPAAELTGLLQTDVCSEGGDSGGPVYTTTPDGKTLAVGVISGGEVIQSTGRCAETAGLPNVTYVVPLSETLAHSTDTSADYFLKVAP